MKRAFDLLLTAMVLVLISPLLGLIALAILCADGSPVIFRQTRIGRNGRPFVILKFRTMRDQSHGTRITIGPDQRITRLGQVLRRRKLDELPQLVNVLRGEMSLVGWRPELPEYVERSRPLYDKLLAFSPGITDPAAIEYRAEADVLGAQADPEAYYLATILPRKVSMSLHYARHSNVLSDFWMIMRSLG